MKYMVEIVETLSKTVEVEADSEQEAYSKVEADYADETIVLDDTNFIDTVFTVL